MATVLDTYGVRPDERADMVADHVVRAAAPQYVLPETAGDQLNARFDLWELGAATIYHVECSGFRLLRTGKQVCGGPSPVIALGLAESGTTWHRFGAHEAVWSNELFVLDYNLPYEVGWRELSRFSAVLVPLEQLGLPAETIRTAALRLLASPLHDLMSSHIELLVRRADTLTSDPAARELGSASTELVRALLTSAAGANSVDGTAVPADILLTQVREYVRRNLTDCDLGPESIARAHSVSVRYLYKLCHSADFRLEQWIIGQRLERVRAELVRPRNGHRSIAVIAALGGFRDPSHFARRFRQAYGMTPREWRSIARER
ncbi:helix-turn-helix domain-containing protein [Nocardia uniformis]|uniref:Helix-turn-helix domain-containing protein n=1 Tax=Nocardia uniformis TaxID=53432 RepID=A0A849CKK1_9NOCA|nr:helix-turn-helix domain-containing protein [Nocardia uniformis]NNH75571.1 helix-turn-helix domain-containing protein [Nocardia uniformis]